MTKNAYLTAINAWHKGKKETEEQKAFLRGVINGIAFTAILDAEITPEDSKEITDHATFLCNQLY